MLETPELLDVSSLHRGSPSIPKMHLEILKPFDTEERVLKAVIGWKRRDGHSQAVPSALLSLPQRLPPLDDVIDIIGGPRLPFSP